MIHHVRVDPGDSRAGERLVALLRDEGLATFEGVADRAAFVRLAHRIMKIWPHRDSDPDGVTAIRDHGAIARLPGYSGFGRGELTVHTESSAAEHPPQLMMLLCAAGALSGGECRLVDGARLHQELIARDADLLAGLTAPGGVHFGGGQFGSVFATAGDRTVVRFRLDELAQFPPRLIRRLPDLRALLRELEVCVPLAPGVGYLLCNTRWMHGRAAFTGERLVYRLLGNPVPGAEITAGFATTLRCPVPV
jgi:alpha-ketoglutarate-dependent taurine dioxygenase